MELKKYVDFRTGNPTGDKFVISTNLNPDIALKQIVWVVFPKDDKVRPMRIILNPCNLTLTLSEINISTMMAYDLNTDECIKWTDSFNRNMKFNDNLQYEVQGVDKIKIFNTLGAAKDFIAVKTDKDFVKRQGHYYVFTVKDVQGIIGKALDINPKLVLIETKQ